MHQKYILDLLIDFKCLRVSHVNQLICAKYGSKPKHVKMIIQQLQMMGKVTIKDNFVALPQRKKNEETILSWDVMMDLIGDNIQFLYYTSPGFKPFSLMFSVKNQPASKELQNETPNQYFKEFALAIVKPHHEIVVLSYLSAFNHNLTVIFILSDLVQAKILTGVKNKHYFAIRKENGKYRFFTAPDTI